MIGSLLTVFCHPSNAYSSDQAMMPAAREYTAPARSERYRPRDTAGSLGYNERMAGTNQPTRRDFLHGRAAAGLVGCVARAFADDRPTAPTDDTPAAGIGVGSVVKASRSLLASFRRRAMACEFEVQVGTADAGQSTESVLAALDLVEALEAQLTIYRDDSEVLCINRQAADRPVAVEPRLFALLEMAARLHSETDGALDLTTGPLSDLWGFSRRQGRLPSANEVAETIKRVGMEKVMLDASAHTVSLRERGVSLHLNCIGKGFALDRMAESLASASVEDYLLHGGRSSILARGRCPSSERPGWTIGLPHPLRPGERLGEIDLVDQALGTSGSATQSFEHKGRRYGHLLDPRTGRPVTGIYTATAIASSAAEADALSTAFYVMGPEKTARFCATRPDLGAILVCPGDTSDQVRLSTYGLDGRRWRPVAAT
jgi:thiamine biosynthesis lipoprotein